MTLVWHLPRERTLKQHHFLNHDMECQWAVVWKQTGKRTVNGKTDSSWLSLRFLPRGAVTVCLGVQIIGETEQQKKLHRKVDKRQIQLNSQVKTINTQRVSRTETRESRGWSVCISLDAGRQRETGRDSLILLSPSLSFVRTLLLLYC